MSRASLLILCIGLLLASTNAQQLLVQGRVDAESQDGELATLPMTLSWAGTIVSAAFEDADTVVIELDALPANAARLSYNRFRVLLDDVPVTELETAPGCLCSMGMHRW